MYSLVLLLLFQRPECWPGWVLVLILEAGPCQGVVRPDSGIHGLVHAQSDLQYGFVYGLVHAQPDLEYGFVYICTDCTRTRKA